MKNSILSKLGKVAAPLVWVSCALGFVGCQKTITVEQQAYDESLSIESLLQPGEIPRAYINRTVPFFASIGKETPSSLFLRGVNVVLVSNGVTDRFQPDSTFNQFFCRWEPYYVGTMPVLENVSYELHVEYRGRTYSASTMTNVAAVEIDSVSYTSAFTDIYGGHEGVIVDFVDLPGEGNNYRFKITRVLNNEHETTDDLEYSSECLEDGEEILIDEFGRFVYFDANLDQAPVRFVAEPAYTQFLGDESLVFIQSLDINVARFYDTLDRQHEANVNPFAEPVFLKSNIDGALGVFGAVNVSPAYFFVFPEDHIN